MVSDSKKKRLEAKAAKAAAKGEKVGRVKSSSSLKKAESVADSLASQMEDGAWFQCFIGVLLVFYWCFTEFVRCWIVGGALLAGWLVVVGGGWGLCVLQGKKSIVC